MVPAIQPAMTFRSRLLPILLLAASAAPSSATVYITEWMYDGSEFIEFTNVGPFTVDLTGWSFDDDSRIAGTVDLSAFGSVAPGESVILSEATAADFRTEWSLPATVKIIGGLAVNLGRNDEINLFNASSVLVDRLSFGDNTSFPGTIRTQGASGHASPEIYGTNNVAAWSLSSSGGAGVITSASGFLGSPGTAPIPEPSITLLSAITSLALLRRKRFITTRQ